MNDSLWYFLLIALLTSGTYYNNERNVKPMMDMTTREKIQKKIEEMLDKPDISASEIETLARACSELNKNDWMMNFASRTSLGLGDFNGPQRTSANQFTY